MPAKSESPAALLQDVLGETFRLYRETHLAHWNVQGPSFPQLHLLFDGQYNELWEALDGIAERLRTLGPAVDPKAFQSTPERAATDARVLLKRLADGHRSLSKKLHGLEVLATKAGDAATADLAVSRIHAHDKHAWMLEATLAPGKA